MLASARRHALPHTSQSQSPHPHPHAHAHSSVHSHFTKSAPPTPSNAQRPSTAGAAATPASATFSRASGSAVAAAMAAGTGPALHLPPSVPMAFPSPPTTPAAGLGSQLSPLELSIPPHMFMSSPSPLSSGLPSPTLPPLPSSRMPFLPGVATPPSQPIAIQAATPPSQARSPRITASSHARDQKDDHAVRHHHHPARPYGHNRKYSTTSIMSATSSISSPHAITSNSSPSSPRSSHSVPEDVFAPGDRVGAGLRLQGEPLRGVDLEIHGEHQWQRDLDNMLGLTSRVEDDYDGLNSSKKEPAAEFEVVRRLGAGSYAVVYLVKEVMSQPPAGILDDLDDDSRYTADERIVDFDLDFMEQDVWDAGLQFDPSGSEGDGKSARSDDKAKSVYYGREYAVKVLSKAGMDEEALEAQLVEANIHQSLPTHPNIVTLYRTLETSSYLLLILEYVPGDDLFYFLEQARDHYEPEPPSDETSRRQNANKSLTDVSVSSINTLNTTRTPPTPSLLSTLNENQLLGKRRLKLISSMFAQMCEAVAVCHDAGVYHRDIKPENFIVTDGWDDDDRRVVVVKLTDFGLSTRDKASSDMDCGSAPYMSFECRNNCAPTYSPRAADVWSLGIVLINMLYHINPWTDTTQGVCPSFSAFLATPELFLLQRFAGMVPEVASFLARRVFCLLPNDDPMDEAARRVSAHEFGRWVKELPRLMASDGPVGAPPALAAAEKILEEVAKEESVSSPITPTLPLSQTTSLLTQSLLQVLEQQEAAAASGVVGPSSPAWRHRRGLSNASIGFPLSSVPHSRRPASRKASFSVTEAGAMSARLRTMDLSAAPSSTAHSRAATPMHRGRTLSRLNSHDPDSRMPATSESMGMDLPTLEEGEGDMSMANLSLRLESMQQELELAEGHEKADDIDAVTLESRSGTDYDHGLDNEHDQDADEQDANNSRSTSIARKRKRGARKGKGQIILQQQQEISRLQQEAEEMKLQLMQLQLNQSAQVQSAQMHERERLPPPTAPLPALSVPVEQANLSETLVIASETLARELSRKSRSTTTGHSNRGGSGAISPGASMLSLTPSTQSQSRSSVGGMHPLQNTREGAKAAGVQASALAAAGGPMPGAMFPVSFASSAENRRMRGVSPATSKSRNTPSSSSLNVSLDSASTSGSSMSVLPAPTINKKASKWKLGFGRGSSSSQSRATLPQQEVIDISRDEPVPVKAKKQQPQDPADDVAKILDGLSYTGFMSSPAPAPSYQAPPSAADTWRGRKQAIQGQVTPFGNGSAVSLNTNAPSDRWTAHSERNVSPHSSRAGRAGPSSSSSSVGGASSVSSNWRNSTITTGSGSSASSAFTRYSNGSVRSVSTVATSVSGNSVNGSWRDKSSLSMASGERRPGQGAAASVASRTSENGVRMPPPNVKIMTGVPWALNELPRQLQPNVPDDLLGPSARKQRVRKPQKELATISEREQPNRAMKSPLSQRFDAGRSSSDLALPADASGTFDGRDRERDVGAEAEAEDRLGDGPRKVQKGQINALAKMLSALRR